jgi:hypothetical protein
MLGTRAAHEVSSFAAGSVTNAWMMPEAPVRVTFAHHVGLVSELDELLMAADLRPHRGHS